MSIWQEIATNIRQVTGQKLINPNSKSISGGSINQAFLLSDHEHRFFIKTNAAVKIGMFKAEAIALQHIANTKAIRVPRPICYGVAENSAYIVLEWIDFGRGQDWQELGKQLANLHRVSSCQFGWQQQNTIGSTPQINTWTESWVDFFIQHRLLYQLKLARQKGFKLAVSETVLIDAIPRFFQTYVPQPSMVHGDLWSGNIDFSDRGDPVIYDPALYFGDREVDIAMTELFGGFPEPFYQAYNQFFPLDSGYRSRQSLYNLYHILNHFNLFGGGYAVQANQICLKIVA